MFQFISIGLAGIVACENVFLKIRAQLVALTPPDVVGDSRFRAFLRLAPGESSGGPITRKRPGKVFTHGQLASGALCYLNTDERQ